MSTRIDIYNLALYKLAQSIGVPSITDDSKAADVLNRLWEPMRDLVLTDRVWPWAMKAKALALEGERPLPGWQLRYSYPNDCLTAYVVTNPQGIESNGRLINLLSHNATGRYDWETAHGEQGVSILANIRDAWLVYAARIEDASLYPPQFVNALACRLAAEAAPPILGDLGLQAKQNLLDEYQVALTHAGAHSMNESRNDAEEVTPSLQVRGFGGGGGGNVVPFVGPGPSPLQPPRNPDVPPYPQKGESAYQIARDFGFKGSEQAWLDSLKGETGDVTPEALAAKAAAEAAQVLAEQARTGAGEAAEDAQVYAGNAESARDAAAAHAVAASSSAGQASSAADDAASEAGNAASSAAGAVAARNAAQAARDLANEYANAPHNTPVAPGEYSARHWAVAAQEAASGALSYQGEWDASVGTYPAAPVKGHMYVISVAGEIDGINYGIGDNLIYSDEGWTRVENVQSVTSVAGRTGAINIQASDVDGLGTLATKETVEWDTDIEGVPSVFPSNWAQVAGKPTFSAVATTGSYDDLANRPSTFPSSWSELSGKPSFSAVATSGNYADLEGRPSVFPSAWAQVSGKPTFSDVAVSGSYNDLANLPSIFPSAWASVAGKPAQATRWPEVAEVSGLAGALSSKLSASSPQATGRVLILTDNSNERAFVARASDGLEAGLQSHTVDGARVWGNNGVVSIRPMGQFTSQYQMTVTASGVAWDGKSLVMYEGADVVARIPQDYATLQAAIDDLFQRHMGSRKIIELRIDSSHQPASGIYVSDGDYSHFRITSTGASVTLASSWPSGNSFCVGYRARMPNLATVIDMAGRGDTGYGVYRSSTGHVEDNCGVINAGKHGMEVRGSTCYAALTVWTGAGETGIRVQQGSTVGAEGANVSNAGHRGLYVSRGSTVQFMNATATNCGNEIVESTGSGGIVARRSHVVAEGADVSGSYNGIYATGASTIAATGLIANNCGSDGARVAHGSSMDAGGATANNCVTRAFRAEFSATINLRNASGSVTGSSNVVSAEVGSFVSTQGFTVGGSPLTAGQVNVAAFNALTASGVIFN